MREQHADHAASMPIRLKKLTMASLGSARFACDQQLHLQPADVQARSAAGHPTAQPAARTRCFRCCPLAPPVARSPPQRGGTAPANSPPRPPTAAAAPFEAADGLQLPVVMNS